MAVAPTPDPRSERSQTSDARWKLAFEANGDGVWDWDVSTGAVEFSAGLKTMLGYPPDAPWKNVDDWAQRLHPDDVAATMAAVNAHLSGATPSYASEHRVRRADGTWCWVLDRGLVLTRDAAGRPLRVVGSHTDISAARKAMEALENERNLLHTVLEHAPIGLAVHSLDSPRPLYVSARFEQNYGLRPGTITDVTRFFDEVYTNLDEREAIQRRVQDDMASGDTARMRWEDVPLTLRSGERRWVTAVNILVPAQRLVVSTVQDVTHIHEGNDALWKRTEQLRERNDELVRFNRATVDRELRMVELKDEVNALLARLHEPPRYGGHD